MKPLEGYTRYFEQNMAQEKFKDLQNKTVFLGFDAFIDTITRLIKQGNAVAPEAMFEEMSEFGNYLTEKNGENCSVELLEQSQKIGGNMAITANAIGNFGVKAICIGTFGRPEIHSAFRGMNHHCEMHSVGNPGTCVALEFSNGKVMLGLNKEINLLDWRIVKQHVPVPSILKMIEKSQLLCFLNWSELPNATSIFRGMLEEVLCHITDYKTLLVDFSDCSRRTKEEISEILEVLKAMPQNINVILSMNKNEEEKICQSCGISASSYEARGRALIAKFGFSKVCFHNRHMNCIVESEEAYCRKPNICDNPAVSSGAGDNFNAGLTIGLLAGLKGLELLEFAVRSAEYYITYGTSYQLDGEKQEVV